MDGYSSTYQTVSELIAINAHRHHSSFRFSSFIVYDVRIRIGCLEIIWSKARSAHVACFIVGKEVLGLAVTLFAPMHMRGQETTLTDTMHALLTGVGVFLCMFPQ